MDGRRAQPHRHLGPQARPPAGEPRAVRRHQDASCPASSSASTCRSRPADARPLHAHPLGGLPGTATTSRTRSSRPANLAGRAARPTREARHYPAIGSLVGEVPRPEPPGRARPTPRSSQSRSHLAFGGYLGKALRPVPRPTPPRKLPVYDLVGKDTGQVASRRPVRAARRAWTPDRLADRQTLLRQLRPAAGATSTPPARWPALDRYGQQAVEMLTGGRVPRRAGPVEASRRRSASATASTCGASRRCWPGGWSRRACAFVTLDLSYHTASGTWDTHGDNIPPYGGIRRGWGRCCRCSTIW